jgi:hypothetical protein
MLFDICHIQQKSYSQKRKISRGESNRIACSSRQPRPAAIQLSSQIVVILLFAMESSKLLSP